MYPGIGEDVSHLMGGDDLPSIGDDVSHLMDAAPGLYDPARKPASAEDFAPPARTDQTVGHYLSELGAALNPVTLAKGVYRTAQDTRPEDAALGPAAILAPFIRAAGSAAAGEARKAGADVSKGRYTEAAGHAGAAVLPVVGPAAADAGEDIAAGDVAGGLAKATSLLAPFGANEVARAIPNGAALTAGPLLPVSDADTLAFAERAGVPVDAATATSNKFVKAAQHLSDRTLAGSLVATKAAKVQAERLATIGEQLAAKAHPVPVTPEAAGSAAQGAVGDVVSTQRAAANDAYGRLRALEAAPENLTTIAPEPVTTNPDAPFAFTTKGNATVDDIFGDALKDARANGYTGKVGDLRAKFDERVDSARALKAATGEGDEYSHAALLKEIRDRGGIRPFDKDFAQGTTLAPLREESQAMSQATRNHYGKNAVLRNDGVAIDDMHQQLSEDPKWGAVIGPETNLRDVLAKGDSALKPTGADLQGYLRGAGVHPGATWWREGAAAQQVPMAVDLAPVKDAVRPILERLLAKKDVAGALMGSEGTAAAKLHAIVNGPDAVPLSVADSALSDLKRMARANHPDLRNVGQGIAAKTVSELHRAVADAAERAGPDAVSALDEGRTATKAKYAAADVLKTLEGRTRTKTPVLAFRGLTSAGDVAAPRLQDVLAQAPSTKPLIARAVLDGILDHPTAGPAKTYADWQKLGPQTKALLFAPEHARDIDRFLKLRKMIAENPNPSGTAHTALSIAQGGLLLTEPASGATLQLASGMISTLLHSRRGVQLLTRGLRLPLSSKAAIAPWLAELQQVTKTTSPSGSPALLTPASAGAGS